MYQVVLFIVSNEVECVPVAWLKSETQVYWPDGISLSGNSVTHETSDTASCHSATGKIVI